MTPGLLPLLLLLLAGPPAAQPAPPTCYSRMLSLSREVTGDAQRLQAMEPSVSPHLPSAPPGGSVQTRSPKTCLWARKTHTHTHTHTHTRSFFSFLVNVYLKGLHFIPILLSKRTMVCISCVLTRREIYPRPHKVFVCKLPATMRGSVVK